MKQEPVTVRMTKLAHQIHVDMNGNMQHPTKSAIKTAANLAANKLDAYQAATVLSICTGLTRDAALAHICRRTRRA